MGWARRSVASTPRIMSRFGSVNSELSGNMIDLCPVGALTASVRYKGAFWELSRRRSSARTTVWVGLAVQTKNNRVLRVLPIENEDINECWFVRQGSLCYAGLIHPTA